MYPDKGSEKVLAVDTRRRAEVVAEEIGDCLEISQGVPSDVQGEYYILRWW